MSERALHILLIEDDQEDAELLEETLTETRGFGLKLERAASLSEGLELV